MTFTEGIMTLVALVLIVAVPWFGTLLGMRNFDKKLNAWRSTQAATYQKDKAS